MKNFVIGTAGHIDHGKTSLIKSITGINTDTLKEEQKRGITIDLGFSYLNLDDTTVGIVDVPGHEKLIKNMLSGVCGIDMVLLVVAVNDGIMPQTREHFEIIKYLNINNVLVVLTKTDLVDNNRITEVKSEIEKEFNLKDFVEFSIYDDSKQNVIEKIKENIKFTEDDNNYDYFRMPIDRVFNVKGHGVIVTGSSISGKVELGDKLEILPNKELVKVKGIQVFKQNRKVAYKKTRIALNLGGIKKEDINRGTLICSPDKVRPSKILDVKITVTDKDIIIKHLETLKFYYLANEVRVRVKLFNKKSISSSDVVYAQLLLDKDLYAVNNDLGVLRKLNNTTVAGVEIINVQGEYANRKSTEYIDKIKTYETGDVLKLVSDYIKNNRFCKLSDIENYLGVNDFDIKSINIDFYNIDNTFITTEAFNEFKDNAIRIVTNFHRNNKYELGINKNELKNRLKINTPNKVFTKYLNLIDELDVKDIVKLKSHTISLTKEESIIRTEILNLINSGEFKPPKFNDIFSKVEGRNVDDVYFTLIKRGDLIKIDDDITLTKELYSLMIEKLDKYFSVNKELTLSDARNILNTSRRYVVPYLEYLDKIGYTRRVENVRIKK